VPEVSPLSSVSAIFKEVKPREDRPSAERERERHELDDAEDAAERERHAAQLVHEAALVQDEDEDAAERERHAAERVHEAALVQDAAAAEAEAALERQGREMCADFQDGFCSLGEDCDFAHTHFSFRGRSSAHVAPPSPDDGEESEQPQKQPQQPQQQPQQPQQREPPPSGGERDKKPAEDEVVFVPAAHTGSPVPKACRSKAASPAGPGLFPPTLSSSPVPAASSAQSSPPGAIAIVPAGAAGIVPEGPQEETLYNWLEGLDNKRGALLQYFDVMRREFDADFSQILAVKLETPTGPGVLDAIDPMFWEVVQAKSMGHKLLLAKGIYALRT